MKLRPTLTLSKCCQSRPDSWSLMQAAKASSLGMLRKHASCGKPAFAEARPDPRSQNREIFARLQTLRPSPSDHRISIFKVSCGVGAFLEDPNSQSRFFSRPLMDLKKLNPCVHFAALHSNASWMCIQWAALTSFALVPGTETTELSLFQNSSELLYQFDHLASENQHAFSSQEAEWQCLGGCRINFADAEAEKDKLRQPSC